MQARHDQDAQGPRGPISTAARIFLAVLALLLIVLFIGLGTWQVQRLQWKRDLIARVDARVHAQPVPAPVASQWGQVSRPTHEYLRVQVAGNFLFDYTTPVQAVTDLGPGFWLLTPLCTPEGRIVFINRGFTASAENLAGRFPARRAPEGVCLPGQPPSASVTGLLRITEPGGGFLRENDPVGNRWYSRDVQALAAARGLDGVAPYFIDAARGQEPAGALERAVGGLTVVSFQNNHLVYALTWYALALMVAAAWWWVVRGSARSPA